MNRKELIGKGNPSAQPVYKKRLNSVLSLRHALKEGLHKSVSHF